MSSTIAIDPSQIHQRAYTRWQERGCPVGSPDQDWFAAEAELVRERAELEAASAKLIAVVSALPPVKCEPAEKKAATRLRAQRGRITSPLTLNAETVETEVEPQSKVHARASAIPRPSKRRKVAR